MKVQIVLVLKTLYLTNKLEMAAGAMFFLFETGVNENNIIGGAI